MTFKKLLSFFSFLFSSGKEKPASLREDVAGQKAEGTCRVSRSGCVSPEALGEFGAPQRV